MIKEQDKIKLIFGFKVKYMRQQKNLSYQQLSEITGLSSSYIHEIEKGKKYPKAEKTMALAKAFGVDYDYMVSINASKKLQPIIDLLNSDVFKIFPTEMFGIDISQLMQLLSNTPDKVNAFIGTIFKITRNYQMTKENFYLAALRSYQDMNDNYFEDLELAVKSFRTENNVKGTVPYTSNFLASLLEKKYNITIDREELAKKKTLTTIRSYFNHEQNILYINKDLSTAQENFLLGRELGFQYLALKERPYETRIINIHSFEQLLNNFKASYFSVALLMDEHEIKNDIINIASPNKWEEDRLLSLLTKYDVTPEMLLQRMTNILPKHLNINDIFFLRISSGSDLKTYNMTKELHLSQVHNPYANENNEHYCQRWISIKILKKLRTSGKSSNKNQPIADAQVSKYWETPNEYLCLTIAKPNTFDSNESTSVTIGLLMNDSLRKIFKFLSDSDLKYKEVNTTCERCSMPDCGSRVAPPIAIERKNEQQEIKDALLGVGKN